MRKLLSNKSKFLAALCCLCLGLASLFAGVFSFVKLPASADEVVDANAGFYVEKGASFRYDDVVPAIRFSVALTEDQWEAYKTANAYTEDMAVKFDVVIHMANRPNQDGTTSTGYTTVSQEVTVKAVDNFFANNPGSAFTVKPAIMLTDAWNGETTEGKTSSELYALYAGAEFHVAGIKLTVNGAEVVRKDTTDYVDSALTLRSVRSVAASLLLQGKVVGETNIAIAENFIKDANGVKAELVKDGTKYFYDKYADTGVVDLGENAEAIKTATSVKTTLGSTNIAVTGVDDGVADLAGVASLFANDGNAYSLNFDCVDTIYAFNNVIAVTEIFYAADGVARLNARFAQTKTIEDVQASAVVETIVKDGVEYSATFYDVDRGYYVLGEDIDFGGDWTTLANSATNSMYHTGGDYRTLSGLVGFGGTFDGNGHTIKNFRVRRNNSTTAPLGLFGNLAYGAKVKNLGIVDAYLRDVAGLLTNNSAAFLANSTGSYKTANATAKDGTAAKDTYNYLVAKFGEDNWGVEIDNCYFGVDKATKADYAFGGNIGKYNSDNDPVFNLNKADTGTITKQGQFGVTLEGFEGYITFKNSVLELPKNNDRYGQYNNGGFGWVSTITYGGGFRDSRNGDLGILENCYQITEEADTGRIMGGHNFNVSIGYTSSGAWDTQSRSNIQPSYADAQYIKLGTSITIYAANDYSEVEDGTKVYDWYDADSGKWLFSATPEELGKTANTTIYHYDGLNRYNNYVDMSVNNTNSLAGFNGNWEVVNGAVIWNGLAEATSGTELELTFTKDGEEVSAIEKGDTITVNATANGQDATKYITLASNNNEIVSISGNTFTVSKSGEFKLTVTAGGYTAEYDVSIVDVNDTPVTVSSNYSAIYGKDATYSAPYVASGNDLVATDFLSIYQNYYANNEATISNVYLVDDGAKTALTAVDVEGVAQYAFANAGNEKKVVSVIIDGSEGMMGFADISTVTGVIADEYGFKYIPTDYTTRAGYYVLANDYNDDKTPASAFDRWSMKAGEMGSSSNELGYSFGGLDLELLADMQEKGVYNSASSTWTSVVSTAGVYAFQPFTGTFDGLGHTVDNMMFGNQGLLGRYNSVDDGATLKNVKFTNVRSAYYYWTGNYNSSGEKVASNGFGKEVLLATLAYPVSEEYPRLTADQQINISNVVVEMATSGHRTDIDGYAGTDVYSRWSVFRFEQYPVFYESKTKGGETKTNIYNMANLGSNVRTANKLALNNVVFNYAVTDKVAYYTSTYGGTTLFSGSDQVYGNMPWRYVGYLMRDFENVYVISAPTSTGRTAVVTDTNYSGKVAQIGLPANDFDTYFGTDSAYDFSYTFTENGKSVTVDYRMTVNGRTTYTTSGGWGFLTTVDETTSESTKEFVYTTDLATYTAGLASNQSFAQFFNIDGSSTPANAMFYATPFYRYDDYSAMATAGKTQIGNFAVSADGIVWSPAN